MGKTIVSISFDDGRIDTYTTAYPILKKYNLPATLHIATGFIDGTMEDAGWKSCDTPMTKENVYEMYKNGIEISSHGDKHKTESEDFSTSVEKFDEWGIDTHNIGFSVPNSAITDEEKKIFKEFLKGNNFGYMRVGRHKNCYTMFSKLCYVAYKITGIQVFYNLFNKHNLNFNKDPYSLYSVVVHSDDRTKNITGFINKYNEDAHIILMLHSVLAKADAGYGKDKWYIDEEKFDKLCRYLKKNADEGKIEIKTLKDAVGKEDVNV